MWRIALALVAGLALAAQTIEAGLPDSPAARAQLIGRPVALQIQPEHVHLNGPRSAQQLLVTGRYADGSQRDLTGVCTWRPGADQLINIDSHGRVNAVGDGQTDLQIEVGGLTLRVPVTITNSGQSRRVSFRRELIPALSTAGCSDIRCHGAPSGKNGFRLSLWGFDPDLDYRQLTHDLLGRRTNAFDPNRSLILLKALAEVPHVGGRRFAPHSAQANIFRAWQAEGRRDDATIVELHELTVTPARHVLRAPARWQQLAVRATFEDEQPVDVTHLTTFSSSDLAIAAVDDRGLVEFHGQGEVAILCRFLGRMFPVRLMHIAEPDPQYRWPNPPQHNYVDTHVFAKLKMLNVAPSQLCSDEEFVRRLYLDLCGVLPTPQQAVRFVTATQTDKRSRLTERLLQSPEYADYWTKKWLDVLRVSRDSIQLAGAQAVQTWLRERIANDQSFAEIARDLLTSQGKSYRDAAANFYCVPPQPKKVTDPFFLQKDLAEATAQLFLGVRLQCAKCHNHPYEHWTQRDYLSLAAHFTQIKRSRLGKAGPSGRAERRQIAIALDLKSGELTDEETGQPISPRLPGQPATKPQPAQDRRQSLAAWLTQPDNPFFAKALVNRVWFHLHGRGIVEPVDDFRDSNPSANDALLTALADDFVAHGFRLKPLIRRIVTSRTYQLSPATTSSNEADQRYFSHRFIRPLPAEVLLDAICHVTGVPEPFEIANDYTIGIPQGSLKLPPGTRAVQLPVNDIVTLINTSSKYVRYESHPFLRAFGQPSRTQTCECDREQHFGRKQALELSIGEMTSSRLALPDNRLGRLLAAERSDEEILRTLYLCALSRSPSKETTASLLKHVADSPDRRQSWEDILWTILNSQEFIYQH